MTRKFTVLRSESKLKDLDPTIQKLFDQKHVKIIKAQEKEEKEAVETQDELIKTMIEGIITNTESIQKILEQKGLLGEEEESEEEEQEQKREAITKSLESQGFDVRMVEKGKRLRLVE